MAAPTRGDAVRAPLTTCSAHRLLMRLSRMHRSAPATFALLLLSLTAPAFAWEAKLDSTGTPVRWSRDLTFVAQGDAAAALGDPAAQAAIDAAVSAMEAATPGLRLRVQHGATDGV